MTHARVSALVIAALTAAACEGDAGFGTPPPVAGVRFINAVADTGAMDFRVVDIVGDAPQLLVNTFRAATSHHAVQAGTRRLKVFMTPPGSPPDTIAFSPEVWDTTFTFTAGTNYSFIMTGFSRTGQTPVLRAVITPDVGLPTPGPGQFAIRVLNLAPSLAGAVPALTDTTVLPDAFVRLVNAVPSGMPEAAAPTYLGASPYVVLDTGLYRLALTATGTTGPVIAQARVPPGARGTPTQNPDWGSRSPGSVLTAIIVPRSVPLSGATQTRPANRSTQSGGVTRSNDTVTVQSGSVTILTNRSPAGPDSAIATTGTGATTATSVGDVVFVSGATQPEYNGWQTVIGNAFAANVRLAGADSLSCNPVDNVLPGVDTPTRCNATNVQATTYFRFRYRISGTPASPATGTPAYRVYPPFGVDFGIPYVIFVSDRQLPLTVPTR